MSKTRFRTLAWTTLAVTVLVVLWGALVRATDSGDGCGSNWPTCHGEVFHRPKTLQTLIELTHRVSSGGVLGVLILVEVVWAFRAFPRAHPVRKGAVATLVLMITESLLGAALVLLKHVGQDRSPARAVWMAIHLANTFSLIAALACTAFWAAHEVGPRLRAQGRVGALLGVGAASTMLIGISGALTALGDTLFKPTSLAQGLADDIAPAAHFLQQLRVVHPAAAVLGALFLLYARSVIAESRPSPAVKRWSIALAALIVAQIGLGFVNLALLAPVWMQIVHLLFADLVWIAFVLLAAAALSTEPLPAKAAAEPALSAG
ncbi:MAG: COX15/CtaA family protein [Byssovorax sp.]